MRFSVGFAAPLTGPQSIVGIPMLRLVELAAADMRRDGVDLGIVAVDDEADEAAAVQAAASLVAREDVIAVVGHKNSGPSRSAAPVYAASVLTQVTQCSTDNALTRSGWNTFFRLCADNERQAGIAARYVHAQLSPRRPVAVHDGTDYGRPLAEAFVERLHELAGVTAQIFAIRVGQQDMSQVAEIICRTGADVVYIGATEVEGSQLTLALRAAGVEAPVITSEGGPHNSFPRLAGVAAEGSVHTYAGADPAVNEITRSLTERCLRELGEAPSFLVECYEAVMTIAAALKTGATTRASVRDSVAATDLAGLGGPIRFDANGDRIDAPVSLWKVEHGRMVPLVAPEIPQTPTGRRRRSRT